MDFRDKNYIIELLRRLMPFPPNLMFREMFDMNRLVDLLSDYYKLSKVIKKIDVDFFEPTSSSIEEIYSFIFEGVDVDLDDTVAMYPFYIESNWKAGSIVTIPMTVVLKVLDLKSFLMYDYFRLTNRFKFIDVGNEDAVIIFMNSRLIVNVNIGEIQIFRVNHELESNQSYIRPTLLYSKVFFWRDFLASGTYLLKYSPSYSSKELSEFALIVDEILEFPPGVVLGVKYPVIVENVSLQTCLKLKDMLNNYGIEVVIEEKPQFDKIVLLGMPRDHPDIIPNWSESSAQ